MGVIPISFDEKPKEVGLKYWLKRQAMHLVNQLPEDHDQALQVLEYARKFHKELLTSED